jgi:hypothetical protein
MCLMNKATLRLDFVLSEHSGELQPSSRKLFDTTVNGILLQAMEPSKVMMTSSNQYGSSLEDGSRI